MSVLRPIAAGLVLMAAGAACAQVKVDNAWVRGAVPGQLSTGAFLDMTSARDAKVARIESPVAGVVEVHASETKNGMMTMRAVPAIALPAGKPVRFAPGGYHIMLMDLKQPVKTGDTVPLRITVETGDGRQEVIDVRAPVRAVGTTQQHQHQH